jgi:hypothetical protein
MDSRNRLFSDISSGSNDSAAIIAAATQAATTAATAAASGVAMAAATSTIAGLMSTTAPLPEAMTAAPGSSGRLPDASHTHPSISVRHRVTLDSNGLATVTWAHSFAIRPGIFFCPINPGAGQVTVNVTSETVSNGVYVGCVIKGFRSRPLPTLSPVSATLLSDLVTGVNAISAALTGFDANNASAAGVEVNVIAIPLST